jgi:hypothetical protein
MTVPPSQLVNLCQPEMYSVSVSVFDTAEMIWLDRLL